MVCSNLLSPHHACRRTIVCTCLQTIYKDVNILHFVHLNREYHVYNELVENYHAFIVMKSCKPTITMLSIFISQYATALLLIPCNYKHMNRKPLSILGCYNLSVCLLPVLCCSIYPASSCKTWSAKHCCLGCSYIANYYPSFARIMSMSAKNLKFRAKLSWIKDKAVDYDES